MKHRTIVVDGVRYVPEEKKSDTQGYTDRELINRAMFEADEHRDPVEEERKHYEKCRCF